MIIAHSEYVGDVISGALSGGGGTPTAFTLQTKQLQGGLSDTLPWASTIINNFVKWKPHKVTMAFVSTSANALNSTNTALGIVAMRHQVDPTFPVDTSLSEMENSGHTVRKNPSQSFVLPIMNIDSWRTVRPGAQPANTDLRFYDAGYVEIVTQGMQAANINLGQLWITYEIEVKDPILQQGQVGKTIRSAHYIGSSYSNALPLGTTALTTATNARGVDFIGLTFTGTTITFPNTISTGSYIISAFWSGNVGAAVTLPVVSATGGQISAIWYAGASTDQHAPAVGESATMAMIMFEVAVNAPGSTSCVVTFGAAGTLPATPANYGVYVVQTNPLTN